jgi:Zn-dependent peptidase ImmA (M78 family)
LKPRYSFVCMRARNLHKNIMHPPAPVYDIARTVARVVYTNEPVIRDAACFYLYEHKDPCIFINMYANENRIHYSIAHEVAHIVLDHFEILKKYAQKLGIPINDKLFFWCDVPKIKPLLNALEREAEIFAAELLMPIKWLDKPRNKNDFENLRDSLGVSNQALIYRLDETGIIPRTVIKRILNGQQVGVRTPW